MKHKQQRGASRAVLFHQVPVADPKRLRRVASGSFCTSPAVSRPTLCAWDQRSCGHERSNGRGLNRCHVHTLPSLPPRNLILRSGRAVIKAGTAAAGSSVCWFGLLRADPCFEMAQPCDAGGDGREGHAWLTEACGCSTLPVSPASCYERRLHSLCTQAPPTHDDECELPLWVCTTQVRESQCDS